MATDLPAPSLDADTRSAQHDDTVTSTPDLGASGSDNAVAVVLLRGCRFLSGVAAVYMADGVAGRRGRPR
jgi:hypothetical protein